MTEDRSPRRRRGGRPVVGQTGARFGGTAGRRCRADTDPPEEDSVAELQAAEAQHEAIETQRPSSPPLAVPTPQAVPTPPFAPPPAEPVHESQIDWDAPGETYGLVRPYAWTGGRTAARVHLAVETLVSATGRMAGAAARPEHSAILELCVTPRSVAELAALLSMPLGVARVLLGDLAAAGSIAVHPTAGSADAAPDIALMQRVLSGLRQL